MSSTSSPTRRLRLGLLLLAFVLILAPTALALAQSGSGIITNVGRLNVRSGPGVGFPVVTRIDAGANVGLVGRSADASWVQVTLPGNLGGWINARFVTPNIPLTSLPVVSQSISASGTVHAFYLNVRTGPGAGFSEIGLLGQGDGLTMIGRNFDGSWVQIVLPDGRTGWVNRGFVTTSFDVSYLPIADGQGQGGGGSAPVGPTGTVTAGFLNLRFGPGAHFGIVARLSQGTFVNVGGRNPDGSWIFIQVPGVGSGWVNALYVQTSVPVNTLPITVQ